MNLKETIDASKRLGRLLDRAITDAQMPEIGGKKLAGEFSGILGQVRALVAEVREEVAGAAAELMTEVKSGKEVAKAIRSETVEVRRAFAEVLGNAPPADETPPKSNGS